jgi:hypothetical protein
LAVIHRGNRDANELKGDRDKNVPKIRKEIGMRMHCLADKDRDEKALKGRREQ